MWEWSDRYEASISADVIEDSNDSVTNKSSRDGLTGFLLRQVYRFA